MLGRLWGSFFAVTTDPTIPLPPAELKELTGAIKKLEIDKVDVIVQNAKSHHYDLNTYTNYNFTPLHYALTRTRRDNNEDDVMAIITLLNDNGADINKLSGDGLKTSPLHTACRRGMPEFVQWLIDRGADKEARDRTGQTPLDYVEKLIEKKPDANLRQIRDILLTSPRHEIRQGPQE